MGNKRNSCTKHILHKCLLYQQSEGKTNSIFVTRNSYSNVREELGRRILKGPAAMNYKNSENTEVG